MKYILIYLLAYTALTHAQTGSIFGKVTDIQTREPLIGASVFLKDSSSIGATTDIYGNYEIKLIPQDTHAISVYHIAYYRKTDSATVVPNKRTRLDFKLKQAEYHVDNRKIHIKVTCSYQ